MWQRLASVLAHVAVFMILGATAVTVHGSRLVRRILGVRRRARAPGELRMLVTGTFYHENWLRSHILPLSHARALSRIYVVTDRPLFAVNKVSYICPPRWVTRVLGRPVGRLAATMWVARRYRPDVLMGYHIMPNAILCLLAASVFGGRSIYQMTGGPIQIIGGGTGSENTLLRLLRRHSPVLERLLYHVVRQFDAVACRGERAVSFLRGHRLTRRAIIIPGSVDTARFQPSNGHRKSYDLVLVARHIVEKQPDLFLEIVDALRRRRPEVRAALVGDGPLTAGLKAQAQRLGLGDHVRFLGQLERIDEVLADSAVFMLTSRTEGLSIAMVEAMAAGLPVLAPDVGELGCLLRDGDTGMVIRPESVAETAETAWQLLHDPDRLRRMSASARRRVVELNSVAAVAGKWDRFLPELTAEGCASPPNSREQHAGDTLARG